MHPTPRRRSAAVPALPAVLTAALALALLLALLPAPDADAAGYGRFQVGGRGTAQVGAFVARADDPHAVTYNPAGITELDGVQVAGGLDFSNATDEFTAGDIDLGVPVGSTYRADHSIQFPLSAFVTWTDRERLGRWSLGFGLDTPHWYRVDFDPALFPLRFFTRVNEVEVWQLHPVAAYRIDDRWSVGGGLRYQMGQTSWGRNAILEVSEDGDTVFPVEFFEDYEADVDGFGADLGIQYRSTLWGFGALYRSKVELEGNDDSSLAVRDAGTPGLREAAEAFLVRVPSDFDVTVASPAQLHAGVWFAPYPELRLELDAVWTAWSDAEQTFDVYIPAPGVPTRRFPLELMNDFDDTLSLRLGVEGDLSEFLVLSGGVALEESPVRDDFAFPAWPRGDAMVYAVGASFRYERVRFDLGYSFHDHDGTSLSSNPGFPGLLGSYSSDSQVWSASAHWGF